MTISFYKFIETFYEYNEASGAQANLRNVRCSWYL